MAPSAVRVADLNARIAELGFELKDDGNLPVPIREMHRAGDHHSKYLKEIAETCKRQSQWVQKTLRAGAMPLIIGGDHSIAVGTVAGVAGFYGHQKKKVGLIWVDAHADMNTPQTSPSGNIHGMGLASILGYGPRKLTQLMNSHSGLNAQNAVLVGVRDIDSTERDIVKKSGLTVYTMRDIDERGLRAVMQEAISTAGRGTVGFCVSLDVDFVDPSEAPGVGTPVRGGATYREAHLVMEMIADAGRMLSLEVVEVNPVIDVSNRTANLAVELILSALGKKIL
jgi:arginase